VSGLVERSFTELTNRKMRRSAHRTVVELEANIRKLINARKKDSKLFIWTKTTCRHPKFDRSLRG
jgi:ribosomal protein L4